VKHAITCLGQTLPIAAHTTSFRASTLREAARLSHAICDILRHPVESDITQAELLLEKVDPDAFLADRVYDADRLTERGINPVNINNDCVGADTVLDNPGDIFVDNAYRGAYFRDAIRLNGGMLRIAIT
jgi:hypothetical protein